MYTLLYGDTPVPVPLPEGQIAQVLTSNPLDLPRRTPEEHIVHALDHPIGAPVLEEVVSPGDTVCVVVSDITRRWQSPALYMPILIERLNRLGVPDGNILILSATGIHRTQTPEEWRVLLGGNLCRRVRHEDHRCDDDANLTYLGETSRGTPVWVNSKALACDRLILTGGVAYHPLAGFSGGRKSLVPGIAGRETINRNHNLALSPGGGTNPSVRGGNMSPSNPFHDDQLEASALARPDYLLNVVAGADGGIAGAFAGDWIEAHQAAARLVEAMDGIGIERRYPLVLAGTGGPPKDMNLSQTTKTLANTLHAVAPGGTIIILSQCREGFGDPDCEKQLRAYETMEARERALRESFTIGGFFGYLFAESAEQYRLILVTDIPAHAFARTRIHAVPTLEAALALAADLNGGSIARLPALLMPRGASTLPKPRRE